MEIISRAEHKVDVYYTREFQYKFEQGCGASFPCDEQGNLEELIAAGYENYSRCVNDPVRVIDKGIVRHEHHYTEFAVGKCQCGKKVTLYGFTNTCECGKDYNWNGQLLAPRALWEE